MTIRTPAIQSRDPLIMVPGGDSTAWPPDGMPFSDDARRALIEAQRQSARRGHNHLSPPHIFVGAVMHATDGVAGALRDAGVTADNALRAYDSLMGDGSGVAMEDITLTPLGRNVLERAVHESRRMQHEAATTAHLLIASVHWKDVTTKILEALGLTPDQLTALVMRHLDVPPSYGAAENATLTSGPYERFADDARQLVALAAEEARAAGERGVNAQYFLLGLARLAEQGDPEIQSLLARLGVSAEAIRRAVAPLQTRVRAERAELLPTAAAKLVIEHALHLADGNVRVEHLLLAIDSAHDSLAGYVLKQLGVTPERIRAALSEAG